MSLDSPLGSGKALSYHEIEAEMIRMMNSQEELVERLSVLAAEAAEAEAEFKLTFHVERYNARSNTEHGRVTADMAEDMAVIASATERGRYLAAQAKFDSTKQAVLTSRSNLESLRSLMASYRETGG